MKPEVRKRRKAAGQAREDGNPTTFYPKLHKRLPGVPERPLRAASGCFKISRETHHCLTSVRPSTELQLEGAHSSIYCATFLAMLELLGESCTVSAEDTKELRHKSGVHP